jgi:hypothetical protein
MVQHGHNGLLCGFYDVDGFVSHALDVLDHPGDYEHLGTTGAAIIRDHYSLQTVTPRMLRLYERAMSGDLPRTAQTAESSRPEVVLADRQQDPGQLANVWPATKPQVEPCRDHHWLRPADREFLAQYVTPQVRTALVLGARSGLTTRALAALAPQARIIAVETWHDDHRSATRGTAEGDDGFSRFVTNCWSLRDRVTLLDMSWQRGLETVDAAQLTPDLIFVQCSHTVSLESDIETAQARFPQAVLVGDGWTWPRAQRATSSLAKHVGASLETAGNLWCLS